jgi:hypothetical protein
MQKQTEKAIFIHVHVVVIEKCLETGFIPWCLLNHFSSLQKNLRAYELALLEFPCLGV